MFGLFAPIDACEVEARFGAALSGWDFPVSGSRVPTILDGTGRDFFGEYPKYPSSDTTPEAKVMNATSLTQVFFRIERCNRF
jgi:hypothetical protein